MKGLGNAEILGRNLRRYVDQSGKLGKDIAAIIGVSPATFSEWMNGKKYPRIDKIEMLANYFHIQKSDLIEDHPDDEQKIDAATSRAKYSDGIDRLARLDVYNLPVRRCTPATLSALIAAIQGGAGGSRPVAVRTAVALTEALRMALSWAAARQLIPVNPLAGAQLPKTEKRQQRILTEDDIADLVKASENNPFRMPLLLALYGGLRREEAAALRWQDVDFKRRALTIRQAITRTSSGAEVLKEPKTAGSRRTVTMPRFVMDELRLMSKPCDRVCATPSGQPYRLDSYPQAVRRLIEHINAARAAENQRLIAAGQRKKIKAPMPLATYHDLRHTHAAMLIRMGVQPKVIQERLGHASIKMTMDLYGYLMPGLQESVADALDADFQMAARGHKSGHTDPDFAAISC